MKHHPQSFRAIAFCLLALLFSVVGAQSSLIVWTGASGTDTNWSNGANWSSTPTPPGTGDDVKFYDIGNVGTAGTANNLVDGIFSGTVNSLQYGNTNGFQTTAIAAGQTLTIGGTNGISVFTPGDPGVKTVRATVTGANGTLRVNSALANMILNQGDSAANGSMGTLDLSGLGTFSATMNRIGLGSTVFPNGSGGQRLAGTLFLARTNVISLGHSAALSAYAGTPGSANSQATAIDMSYNTGNPPGVLCWLYLGLSNVINVDSIRIGGDKASASSAAIFTFNPAITNQNPTLTMRGVSGGSSRVTWWVAGDMGAGASGGNTAVGTNDFSNGTVDIMVDTLSMSRDAAGAENAGGALEGVLTFNSGVINANTVFNGNQVLNTGTIGSTPMIGIINLTGPNAKLVVNANLTLGRTVTAAPLTRGFLNVSGGTVNASNIVIGATSGTNSINLSAGATLTVSNTLATSAVTLTNLTMADSTLGLTVTADSATKAFLGKLVTGGATNWIRVNVPVFAAYPVQIPLIKYSSLNSFNFGLTNVPASAPGAFLVNNTGNNSIDLVLPTDPRPIITSVTPSYAGNPGDNVSFTVTYTGVTPLFVQWQENGSNVVNRTTGDGSVVSGGTADTVSINNAQPSDSGNYTAVVTNAFGSATSAPPSVLVISLSDVAPIITGPNNVTAIQGTTANLTASIAGKPVPAVQWQTGGTNIPGATLPTLSIPNVQFPHDQGTYFVIATNVAGAVTNSAVLTVIVPPVITNQPVSLTVTNTQSATFTAGASGVPAASYQWKKNGNPITGATSPTFTIASTAPSDTATYACVITNLAGATNTVNVTLTVDSTMSATAIIPNNNSVGICYDTPLTITFSQAPTLRSVGTIKIYNTASSTPVDTIDLSANNGAGTQQHSIFQGDGTSIQYFPVVITGNTAVIYPHSGVMTSNQTYYVLMDAGVFADSVGAFFAGFAATNQWQFATKVGGPANPLNMVVNAAGGGDFNTVQGAIDSVPVGNLTRRIINIRDATYFELVNIGKSNITFRGQSRLGTVIKYPNNATLQAPSGGSTQARMTLKVNGSDIAFENLWITNSTPQGGSQAEALMVNSGAKRCVIFNCDISSRQDTILANVNSSQAYFNGTRVYGNFDYIWGGGNLYFDRCTIHAILGTAGPNTTAARTDTSGTQSAATPWVDPNGTTYSANGFSFVNTRFESDNGTTNATLAGSNGTAGGLDSWAFCTFETNYVKPSDTLTNQYVFWQYQNSNFLGSAVSFANLQTLTNTAPDSRLLAATNIPTWFYGWSPVLAPNILTNPVSQSVSAGGSANFGVLATGIPAPTYQWLQNGTPIPGATSSTFNIASAVRANGGGYSVVVSNVAGVVTSTVATLTYTGNVNPVANPTTYSRNTGFNLKIAIAALGWTDADGDALSITTISSTNAATVTSDANFIYYSDPNNVADEIDYSISDGNGGTASSTIIVLINAPSTNQTMNIVSQSVDGNGFVTINFAGIPNYIYWVEATTNLLSPDWQPISTNTAGPNGLWNFTDTNAPNFIQRYYRSFKP